MIVCFFILTVSFLSVPNSFTGIYFVVAIIVPEYQQSLSPLPQHNFINNGVHSNGNSKSPQAASHCFWLLCDFCLSCLEAASRNVQTWTKRSYDKENLVQRQGLQSSLGKSENFRKCMTGTRKKCLFQSDRYILYWAERPISSHCGKLGTQKHSRAAQQDPLKQVL